MLLTRAPEQLQKEVAMNALIIWCRCAFWDNGVDEQPSPAVYR
jgi:hypothetical protein